MKKILTSMLSVFLCISMLFTPAMITNAATTESETVKFGDAKDLYELNIQTGSKEKIDDYLFTNNDYKKAEWISTLSKTDIETLMAKGTALAFTYDLYDENYNATHYDTMLEYLQKLAKSTNVKAAEAYVYSAGYYDINWGPSVSTSPTRIQCSGFRADETNAKQQTGLTWSISHQQLGIIIASACDRTLKLGDGTTFDGAWCTLAWIKPVSYAIDSVSYSNGGRWGSMYGTASQVGESLSVAGAVGGMSASSFDNSWDAKTELMYLVVDPAVNMTSGHGVANISVNPWTVKVSYVKWDATNGDSITKTYHTWQPNDQTDVIEENAAFEELGYSKTVHLNIDNANGNNLTTKTMEIPINHWRNADHTLGFAIGGDPAWAAKEVGNGGLIYVYPAFGEGTANMPNVAPTGNTVTLSYDSNGGSSIPTQAGTQTFKNYINTANSEVLSLGQTVKTYVDVNAKAVYNNPVVKVADAPIKDGYTFYKWSFPSGEVAPGENYTLNKNTVAKASYTANTYTIKLDPNGGTLGSYKGIDGVPIPWKDTIPAVYDMEVKIPTTADEINKKNYKLTGWTCSTGTYNNAVKNLTTKPYDTVTLVAQWEKDDTPIVPQPVDISKIEDMINAIGSQISGIQTVGELTPSQMNEIKSVIKSLVSNVDTDKLIETILNSGVLTGKDKLDILNHLAKGYLTQADRDMLIKAIQASNLSQAEKDALITQLKNISFLSYEDQKRILDALETGSSAEYISGDNVTYILTKGKDGQLTVSLKTLNGTTDLVIPNSLTIAGHTFAVTGIGDKAFKDNKELKTVTIPGNVATIGKSAFENCTALTKVLTTKGLITIGDKAFKGCTNLTSFSCPETVRTIGNSAFEGCKKLTKVTLNNGLLKIGKRAFYKTALKKVAIPKSVIQIGNEAFANCYKLKTVTFKEYAVSQLAILGRGVFANDKVLGKISIPAKVSKIQEKTFYKCKKITSVKGMKNVTIINDSAFEGCSKLERVTLPYRMQVIKLKAFYNCPKLKTVTIRSKALTRVDEKAFKKCAKNVTFHVPNSKINNYGKLLKGKY